VFNWGGLNVPGSSDGGWEVAIAPVSVPYTVWKVDLNMSGYHSHYAIIY
jgi:hypothetical protein